MNQSASKMIAAPSWLADQRPLLEISNLCLDIAHEPRAVRVVDRLSLNVPRGKTAALLGESGCGKSLTALSILRLLPQSGVRMTGGAIRWFDGSGDQTVDLATLSDSHLRKIRGRRISMIFQEPMTTLNPVYPVGQQIVDVLQAHNRISNRAARAMAIDWLRQVGLPAPERRACEYPHQLSGGMRQRVLIAMALCCHPELLIADEPTTALDATVQMQILDLLRNLQQRLGMSILFITHDLGAVASLADYVHVMYAGRIVESAPAHVLLAHPRHPYTQGLLSCVPGFSHGSERGLSTTETKPAVSSGLEAQAVRHVPPFASLRLCGSTSLRTIPGTVPEPASYPTGCRFHTRCRLTFERAKTGDREAIPLENSAIPMALRRCVEEDPLPPFGQPALREMAPKHYVSCWEAESCSE